MASAAAKAVSDTLKAGHGVADFGAKLEVRPAVKDGVKGFEIVTWNGTFDSWYKQAHHAAAKFMRMVDADAAQRAA